MILLLRALSWFAGRLPLAWLLAWGRGLGSFLALCSASRKREVLERIQECLGVSPAEAVRIRKGMYRNLGMTVAEILRLPYVSQEELAGHVRFAGLDNLRVSTEEGLIALTAHTGNWEFMGATTPLFTGRNLHILAKNLKPASFNAWLNQARARFGTQVLDRRGALRESLRILRDGKVLGFMLDQNAKRDWGVFVDFFGREACTSDGLAQIASMTGAPIYPVFSRRLADGGILVEVGPPVQGPANRGPEEILRVTRECTRRIEDFIRAYPDQWIWMHRRWRTRPLADAENADLSVKSDDPERSLQASPPPT